MVHPFSFVLLSSLSCDREVGIILKEMLPQNTVITVIHTEAGGYNELAYGDQLTGKGLEMMVTIGRAMGGVLYKDGYRCVTYTSHPSHTSHP
eukprot:8377405-Pyramimonas_sp.AAC.2